MPLLSLELKPSPFYFLVLLAVALVGLPATLASHLAPGLKWSLLLAMLAALLLAGWQEWRHGVRRLTLTTDGDVLLDGADGRQHRGVYAGHALLGSLAVFVFVGPGDRWRWPGPRRVAVWRDAADAGEFRRLRARVRLGVRVAG